MSEFDIPTSDSGSLARDNDSATSSISIPEDSKAPLGDATNTQQADAKKSTSASDQYQKLTQLEHILRRPDTYIGSTERAAIEMWCFESSTESMVFREVNIVPGLYKIFDEILVNAADNKIRDPSMKMIKVVIDAENNLILVTNDGRGIPVEVHTKERMYIPELIFGNLLTSSNYDDNERKVTGGRNGFGAKLCNIFSTEFTVETCDANTGLLYKQTWTNNMSSVSKPKISSGKNKREFTKITFKPDLAKFKMDNLDNDILSVLKRRVYDLCGTVSNCNIYLNDKKLAIKNFKNYVEMYVRAIKDRNPEKAEETENNYSVLVHEVINDRWEIAFAVSDGTFNQVSFVNSIATTSGGTHIKYISDQIINKLMEALSKKKDKKKLMIRHQDIRNNMFLFVNCLVENPSFTSQTKEQLTTRVSQFGGSQHEKLTINSSFIAKILKTSIADKIRSILTSNEDKALQKEDGSKKLRVKNQVKLVDANKAGTREGHKCTLILTEGDSALSLAVAGLTVVGRDYYGCFPLRGKLLNVREASSEQISKNAEIASLKKIIGLQHKKHYTVDDIKSLRYGHIMIMTDQDTDGSHIKGLLINFFDSTFPGLLQIPGFLLEFITPIVKVTIRNRNERKVIAFYNMPEFEKWRETEGQTCRWTQKYYKGLGTSTDLEGREYFAALDRHLKTFHALQGDDQKFIDLAFSKRKADNRKEWLQEFVPGTHLDPELQDIPIGDFINKELILFSMADNIRSIPSVLDGFKPGQRKVMYGCFKRNLKSEIKVNQLVGYVSENTGYHHGEQSLVQTIIGMAQNFIGSNNLNLLKPNGSFGSRAAGGKDFSAPRYIFTELNELTRKIFNPLDDPLYKYVQDDEQTVEPEAYLPVLPMLLVNGADGIGTGWSTNIPSFNPTDIVKNIRRLMNGEDLEEMKPWYRGWEGDIVPMDGDKFKVKGKIEQIDDNHLEISEIPVKTWTNNVKEFLLAALESEKSWIKDMEEQHGFRIKFIIKLTAEEMKKSYEIGLLERFKLVSSISLGNMVAFDPQGKIKKYTSPLEIIKDFYYVRLEYYQRRKDYLIEGLQNELIKLSEQARFIKLIIDRELSVSNRKRAELVEVLKKLNFSRFDKKGRPVKKEEPLFIDNEQLIEEEEAEAGDVSRLNTREINAHAENENIPESIYSQYDYLLGMSIWSLTRERYEKLLRQKDTKNEELVELLRKSAKDLWNEDIEVFLNGWEKFLEDDYERRSAIIPMKTDQSKRRKRAPAKKNDKQGVKKETEEPPKKKAATNKNQSSLPFPKAEEDEFPTFFKTSNKGKSTKNNRPSLFDDNDNINTSSLTESSEKNTTKSSSSKLEQNHLDLVGATGKGLPSRLANNISLTKSDKSNFEEASSDAEPGTMDVDDDDDEEYIDE